MPLPSPLIPITQAGSMMPPGSMMPSPSPLIPITQAGSMMPPGSKMPLPSPLIPITQAITIPPPSQATQAIYNMYPPPPTMINSFPLPG